MYCRFAIDNTSSLPADRRVVQIVGALELLSGYHIVGYCRLCRWEYHVETNFGLWPECMRRQADVMWSMRSQGKGKLDRGVFARASCRNGRIVHKSPRHYFVVALFVQRVEALLDSSQRKCYIAYPE